MNKPAFISRLSSPIPVKSPKEIDKISKYFKKNIEKKDQKKLYAQASSFSTNSTRETLKIKEAFPNLQNKKIENIQKIIRGENKPKPKFNMTTKELLRKQIIISMNINNKMQFMKNSSAHIANINRALKNIKSKVVADFIHLENSDIVITTNKVVALLDLQTIKQYVKNVSYIKANNVEAPRLPQLKSYLKILGISYLLKNSDTPISVNVVKKIIKDSHIFNNIIIMSRSQKVDFVSFYFLSFLFYFLFFIFSIFRTLGLGLEVISHISHI